MRLRPPSPLLWIFAASALAALLWAASPPTAPAPNLPALLPPGALMTLESADFSALLGSWTHSPEQRAWLGSANGSAFAKSRLFGRLADAQSGFAQAALMPVGSSLLAGVAGRESIFAWYDIGNLEFLYITHLSHEQATAVPLLEGRSHFARRESAGTAFYVRTGTDPTNTTPAANVGAASSPAADGTDIAASGELNKPRTVAFALRGDWLLLSTREDLLARSLQLMAAKDATGATAKDAADSQANAGWFSAATAAGPAVHGDLHMLLDLQALTETPQFRTYWIQRNVTETRRFRAAVVDLYREPHRFREERVLLPMGPTAVSDKSDPGQPDLGQPNLGQLEALVPSHVGVYQAIARPAPDLILRTLGEKLLNSSTSVNRNADIAPAPETALPVSGSATDFDLRIDRNQPEAHQTEAQTSAEAFRSLRGLLDAVQVESMLTLERSQLLGPNLPFVRFQAAVVLHATTPWNGATLTQALSAALRPQLTTASLGLAWQGTSKPEGTCASLAGVQPLTVCTDGAFAYLSNDPGLLAEILARRQHQAGSPATGSPPAQLIAGVYPRGELEAFRRLTTQLGQRGSGEESPSPGTPVQLFRDNLPSLAETFSALDSEHLLVWQEGSAIRQTVLYQWADAPGAKP